MCFQQVAKSEDHDFRMLSSNGQVKVDLQGIKQRHSVGMRYSSDENVRDSWIFFRNTPKEIFIQRKIKDIG